MAQIAKQRKTTGTLVGIAVAAVVIALTLPFMPTKQIFETLESKTYDFRFWFKVGDPMEQDIDDVVIIDVDDYSLAQLGRFQNWPRLYHAKIIDYLKQGGASAIYFDFMFPESDSLKPEMIELFKDVKLDAIQQYLASSTKVKLPPKDIPVVIDGILKNWGYDRDLAEIAKKSGIVYQLIFFNTGAPRESTDIPIRKWAYHFDPVITEKYSTINKDVRYTVGEVLVPTSILLETAKGIGYPNVEGDRDGVNRKVSLFYSLGQNTYPSLDLAVAMDKLGVKPGEVSVEMGKFIHLGTVRKLPIDEEGRMLINYFGNFKKFRYISYADILTERVPAEYFQNKIAIIGASAAGLMDLRSVPFSQTFPGPEIHANIIYTILTGKYVNVPALYINLAILVLAGIITVLISLSTKPIKGALIIFGVVAAYLVACYVVFETSLLWLEIARPLTVIIFTNMAILGYRYLTEEKQKVWIKNMFQGYMSKDLVDKIMANPDMLLMGGDKKEITVFFSDIRGFSSFSEKLGTPERLIALINEYLGAMSDVVLEYNGYISKYEGDAIMAFWGAPTDDPRHAETCIKCVWAMNQRLRTLNADLATRNMPNLFTRFGINTGQVTVGNVGSEKKKSYTAMGDSVNLGSRLEGANKEYGTAIMISEFTYDKVKGLFPVRELDLLRVVGKEQPVRVYELLGLTEGEVPDKKRKCIEVYLKGLALYRDKKWDEAIATLQQALAIDPDDGPSKTYIERCEDFKVLPPPEPWDGVFVMKTK